MASLAVAGRRVAQVSRGYRRILVPMLGNPESERAIHVACRLAAERHAAITVVTVIEVPPLLPLDARMTEEETEARRLHDRATATADAYGVAVVSRTVRAREAGPAILEQLEERDAELVVIGATRKIRSNKRATPFGRTVQQVLRKAPCRVLLAAPPMPLQPSSR
jgi:APA family basic amino acid/polyamine antiporter